MGVVVRAWGKSPRKASVSHLQLSVFERSLAPKLRFHIFHGQFLKEVWYESFVFTLQLSLFGGVFRTKASFFTSLTLTYRARDSFNIFNFLVSRDVSHESFVLTSSLEILVLLYLGMEVTLVTNFV